MDDTSHDDCPSRRRALTRLGGLALGAYTIPAFTTLSVARASGGSGGSGGGGNSDSSDSSQASNSSGGSCPSGSGDCGDQAATRRERARTVAQSDRGQALRRWWRNNIAGQ